MNNSLRQIVTRYNPNGNYSNLHMAETVICNKNTNRCEKYYIPIFEKVKKQVNQISNLQDGVSISKFKLLYPQTYGSDFNFSGSQNDVLNKNSYLSIQTAGKYVIIVSFPWSVGTLPTDLNITTNYATLTINDNKPINLNSWSWVIDTDLIDNYYKYGTMSTTVINVPYLQNGTNIKLTNIDIPLNSNDWGPSYIKFIRVPERMQVSDAIIQANFETNIETLGYQSIPRNIKPMKISLFETTWNVPVIDNNGNMCSNPVNIFGSYSANNKFTPTLETINTSDSTTATFKYSAEAAIIPPNNVKVAGVVCKKSGSYEIQLSLNKQLGFQYVGYMIYTSNGQQYTQMWKVNGDGTDAYFDETGTLQDKTIYMVEGNYIYLTGYCIQSKGVVCTLQIYSK